MRVSIFTGRHDDTLTDKRAAYVSEAITLAAKHQTDLLVLPGASIHDFGMRPRPFVNPNHMQAQASTAGISILTEVSYHEEPYYRFCLFQPSRPLQVLTKQSFIDSQDVREESAQEVLEMIATNQRSFELANKRYAVLICGENNILRNVNHDTPQLRFPQLEWPTSYDVLINPSHTTMSQWNLLHKRFAFFSKEGRTLLYCTNNTKRTSWKSALCIYRDGMLIADGETIHEFPTTARLVVNDDWRLLSLDIA